MELEKFYSSSLGGINVKDEWAYYTLELNEKLENGTVVPIKKNRAG